MTGNQKPPLGVMLDRSHPLAAGLLAYWLMNENSGFRAVDCVNGLSCTITGAAWQPSPLGIALACDGVDDYLVGSTWPRGPGYGGYTIAALVCESQSQLESDSGNYIGALAGRGFLGSLTGCGLYLRNDVPAFQVRYSATSRTAVASAGILDAQWHWLLGVFRRAPSSVSEIWVDGVLAGTLDASALDGLNIAPTVNWAIGTRHTGSVYSFDFRGSIAAVAVWGRDLLAGEVQWFSREPYCMFDTGPLAAGALPLKLSLGMSDMQELVGGLCG